MLKLDSAPLPVGAMTLTDVVPFCIAGAARDLADRCSPVLAANTARYCVGAASWYRALLPLVTPTMLPAVPIRFECGGGAFFMSAHPVRVMFLASAPGSSKGSAASFPGAQFSSAAAAVRLTQPF